MKEPTVILEENSPNGNTTLFVEQDEQTAYMYLLQEIDGERTVKSCWIRNLKPAPDQYEVLHMRAGSPPMMPSECCHHPGGASALAREKLAVVWSEEGDAAALYEEGSLLVVIPAWSGTNGFHGYARDCAGTGPTAWELKTDNVSVERYKKAAHYWKSWEDANFWPSYQEELLHRLEQALGKHERYFAIDGNQWPPKALAVFPFRKHVLLTSIGVGMRSQPKVEMQVEEPSAYRRFELGGCFTSINEEEMKKIAAYISGQTALPWSKNTWLGHGHTLPADAFEEVSCGKFPFALVARDHPTIPPIESHLFRGDPVNFLWLIPITMKERNFATSYGSKKLWSLLMAQCANEIGSFSRQELTFLPTP